MLLDLCAENEIPPGKSRAFRAGGRDVVLFNVDGALHAYENACLHHGASLAGGNFCGRTFTCPAHGWRYDACTGALLVSPSMTLKRFPVDTLDGRVRVEVAA